MPSVLGTRLVVRGHGSRYGGQTRDGPGRGPAALDEGEASGNGSGLAAVRHSQLGEDLRDVALDRAWTEKELLGNLPVLKMCAQQAKDFLLAWC